jgi:hypothetical protein
MGLVADSAVFSLSQKFRYIRQADHNNGQSGHINGIDPAEKYAGNNCGKRQTDNRSDNKN